MELTHNGKFSSYERERGREGGGQRENLTAMIMPCGKK